VMDFGFIFGDYSAMGFTMSQLINGKNKNFASFYASNKKGMEKKLDKIADAFAEEG